MQEKKEDKIVVSNSAIETACSCPTRYYWGYERGLVSALAKDTAPLDFGSAIHKALEIKGKGGNLSQAIEGFVELFPQDMSPKHTVKAGRLILKEYFDRYQNEEMEILHCEYPFKIDLGICYYRGILDKIVKYCGVIMIMDHKTSSQLGEAFINNAKPNGQFTGYIYEGNCEFGEVDSLIIDGLLVPYPYKAKPLVTDFQRIITVRSEMELDRWAENIRHIVGQILEWRKNNFWPKYDKGYNCSNKWAECQYRELCLIPMNPQDIEPPEESFIKKEVRDGEEKK